MRKPASCRATLLEGMELPKGSRLLSLASSYGIAIFCRFIFVYSCLHPVSRETSDSAPLPPVADRHAAD